MKILTVKRFIFLTLFTFLVVFSYFNMKPKKLIDSEQVRKLNDQEAIKSNIIKNLKYSSKDTKGNEYIILANEGEIDFDNNDIIYLTNVKAIIKLFKNNQTINIKSNYGKYNSLNFDTIFSKNVEIDYLDNKIKGNYLDFSMENNLLIISKNVTYSNSENILYADVIKMNTISRDIKIFMHNSKDKVLVQNIN